tara:strand:- start:194 stop:1213 length:1020 start_codon:yes stop_codon:yes gene_type:complete
MSTQQRTLSQVLAMRGDEGAAECNRCGLAANANGDAKTALKLFLHAHELRPEQPNYALSAANMYIKCGQPAPAIALFEALLREPSKLTPKQLEVAQAKLGAARQMPSSSRQDATLLWAACTRDATTLAECGGEDERGGAVLTMAQQILGVKATPGWEFASTGGLRAVKFHVHESSTDGIAIVWAVACVCDSGLDQALARRFVEAAVLEMRPHMATDAWRSGGTLCAQTSFAPAMQRQLERHRAIAARDGAGDDEVAAVSRQAEEVKGVMSENIELLLARGENLRALEEGAGASSRLARTFQEQATRAKRFQMWQQAKYGAAIGGAITIGAAVLLAPIIL